MVLDEFHNFLKSKNKASDKHISFYINWCRQFIQFCNTKSEGAISEHQIGPFLKHMGSRYEQWQVDQAREALSLYCHFISRNNKNYTTTNTNSDETWKSAGETMVRMLRL